MPIKLKKEQRDQILREASYDLDISEDELVEKIQNDKRFDYDVDVYCQKNLEYLR